MSRYSGSTFAKPENALKRAEELINVGQKQAALQALHDVITSKRHRTWQKTLEKIMFKYVELCVDMRKGRIAKDGLMQYRIICQQVNVASLEEVIKHFLQLATERAEQAQSQAQQATLDVEDLEEDQRPEDIMMSFVSAEKEKDRTDRELVTPWFKFLWETYRTVLENLRNNSKLESLYAMTAHRAFQFCLQYKRTTEFRRLCEILRNHLANLNKYRDQRDRPDLTLPETLQLYLDTRFEQLKVATELELWQEAFRAVEDIHGLLAYLKKSPKPQMMATYYAKLTRIFWVSENHLYHAYAWYKLYNLSKSYNKSLTQKDLQMMASAVLLATLIVLPYDRRHGAHHFELEMEKDRNLRMANLLGFSLDLKRDAREVLSRSALLSELVAKGVLSNVPQEVRDIYTVLETEFHPLDLAARVQPLLAKLSQIGEPMSAATPVSDFELQQYVPALERVTMLRALHQVSQVFQTVRLSLLYKKLPFGDAEYVEKLAVDAIQHNYLHMKINHQKGVLQFGGYGLESEKIRPQLSLLTKRLNRAVIMMAPEAFASTAEERKQLIAEAIASAEQDNKKVLARTKYIEKRKEEQERLMLEQEKEEEARRIKQQQAAEEMEAKRLAIESARREKERIQREIEEKEMEEARQLLAEAQRKGKKIKKTGDIKLDKRTLMEEALSEQIRERQEMERKLSKLAKTLDYLERAKREEERPLLEAAYQAKLVEDEKYHAEQQEIAKVQHKEKWEQDIVEKQRLGRMLDDKELFQKQVQTRRADEFERLRQLRAEQLQELRMIRHQERVQRRKVEFCKRKELERLQQKLEEEEARRAAEEEERRKELEAREAEERALEEAARLQREREKEIEAQKEAERERLAREADAAQQSKPAKFTPSFLRSRDGPVSDRERDRERELRDDRSRPFTPGDRDYGDSYRPPGSRGAARDDDRERERDRRDAPYRPDEWRREGGRDSGPPRGPERERIPRDRERDPRERDGGAPSPGSGGGGGGKFVPSRLRQQQAPPREGGW